MLHRFLPILCRSWRARVRQASRIWWKKVEAATGECNGGLFGLFKTLGVDVQEFYLTQETHWRNSELAR